MDPSGTWNSMVTWSRDSAERAKVRVQAGLEQVEGNVNSDVR